MSTELLTGLWEFQGYVDPKSGELLKPSFGMVQEALREFLYFSANGTFFLAKYPNDAHLAFDPDTECFVSVPALDPLLQGTWALEGSQLVEQIHLPSGAQSENCLELPKITNEQLVVREPSKSGTIDIVYYRNDVERFAAPALPEGAGPRSESVDIDSDHSDFNPLIDEIQQEQLKII
ncbi:hypothetical protein C6A37_04215 [Desulfobacteraceae bacterium SEEP-SAG9]|nr:hypothetical protein C6A37_04215 [Desulfobacteraceae bacterium SEEP-SAG9]